MRRGRGSRLISVALAVALMTVVGSPALTAEQGSWTQFGHDAGHSAAQLQESRISRTTVTSLGRAWHTDIVPWRATGDDLAGGAAIMGQTAYVAPFGVAGPSGGWHSRIFALDLATGAVRWSSWLPDIIRWTPAVSGDTVLALVEPLEASLGVVALDAATGARRWYRTVSCTGCARRTTSTWPLVVSDGVAVAAAQGIGHGWDPQGAVWAFDVSDGSLLWERAQRYPGMPIVVDGAVVLTHAAIKRNGPSTLVAFELATGERRWRHTKGVDLGEVLVGEGTDVWGVSGHGRLASIDATDGSVRWRRRAPVGTLVLGPDALYAEAWGKRHAWVEALDRATGALRWRRNISSFGYNEVEGLVLVNDVLLVDGRYEYGDRPVRQVVPSDRPVALRATNGRTIGVLRLKVKSPLNYTVAIAGGHVVTVWGQNAVAYEVSGRGGGLDHHRASWSPRGRSRAAGSFIR